MSTFPEKCPEMKQFFQSEEAKSWLGFIPEYETDGFAC